MKKPAMSAKRKTAIFSIPFNGDLRLMAWAVSTGRVAEIYFAGDGENSSALPLRSPQWLKDERGLQSLVNLCAQNGVKSNLLCNQATLYFSDPGKVFDTVRSLKNLDAITVSDPYYLPLFAREFPNLDVQASIIMELDNIHKLRWMLQLGAGSVVLPIYVNRRESVLKEIKNLKKDFPRLRIKLLANSTCLYSCPFSNWHYDAMVYPEIKRRKVPACRPQDCGMRFVTPEDTLRRPFIRPEDTSYYMRRGYADAFKLGFRTFETPALRRILEAYFSGKYEGDLWELVKVHPNFPPGLRCENSGFPDDFAKKAMRPEAYAQHSSYFKHIAAKVLRKNAKQK